MWRMTPELERGIAARRAQLGDGPYVIVQQWRSLDIDGFSDIVGLFGAYAELDRAKVAFEERFTWLAHQLADEPHWLDEPTFTLPIVIDTSVEGVRLIEQRGKKRKEPDGFNAETFALQLLEIATPPVVGDPLFRALRYDPELARFLSR